MNSNDQTLINVATVGQRTLERTIASCYTLIAKARGEGTADLWLLNMDANGTARISMFGVTVTFTMKG